MTMLLTTLCAASLSAGSPLSGLSQDSFVSSLQRAIAVQSLSAERAQGEIRSIPDDKSTFVLRTNDGTYLTIQVNEKTVFTLDGDSSDRDAALKVGRKADVMHDDGVASRVEVTSKD